MSQVQNTPEQIASATLPAIPVPPLLEVRPSDSFPSSSITGKFGVNNPASFIEQFGWQATYTRPGEPAANFGRWDAPVPPRDAPGIPQRSFLITARRRNALDPPA
jgi:hypothetical protein